MSAQNGSLQKNTTIWGERFNINKPLPEYPRPQMWRQSFLNLNGVWSYAFRAEYSGIPDYYDDDIIVPYPPESSLSGVLKQHTAHETVWYRKFFVLPPNFIKDRVLLHFGGVDQCCSVYVNRMLCGEHEGGYTPFTIDITPFLKGAENILEIETYDDTEKSIYSYGGQSKKPDGITYTAQSGIWQTVWMESVPDIYIKSLKITPLYDESAVEIEIACTNPQNADIAISAKGKVVARGKCKADGKAIIQLRNFNSWSPENPFLYDITVSMQSDVIESYFGMRKIGYIKDVQGRVRFALNNKPYLITGVQSLGLWPDGLYTPAADQAYIEDITIAKKLGFNAIRMFQKIEALRFYYHCDRIGVLVWQDIPQGGKPPKKLYTKTLPTLGIGHISDTHHRWFGRASRESRRQYETQLGQIVSTLYNCPCVVAYSLFNEGKGQFDSLAICEKLWAMDTHRLVDHASGWHDQGGSDVKSRHCRGRIKLRADSRILALTAYGGYSLLIKDYTDAKQPISFKTIRTEDQLVTKLENLYQNELFPQLKKGLSVMFYTRLTDAQDIVNGLVTYNRRWVKIREAELARLNDNAKSCFNSAVSAPKYRHRQN